MATVEELKRQFQQRDRVVRVLTVDGQLRAVAIKNSRAARTAQERHGLEPVGARLLAQALAASALLASFLKGEERILVEAEGDGPIQKVAAEALQVGEVRGYVRYAVPREDGVPLRLSTNPLGTHGLFRVVRILYNHIEPIVSVVELQPGDIAANFEYYFERSEQIPTVVRFDTAFDADGLLSVSAGVFVQLMPGADPAQLRKVEQRLDELPPLGELWAAGVMPEALLEQLLPAPFTVLNSTPIDFFCRCSRERFKELLTTLQIADIEEMRRLGQNELVCQYCGERYRLEEREFEELLKRMRARTN